MSEPHSAPTDTPREIIYAELDDEVMTLVERVRRARPHEVVLVVPAKAQILRSLVNLKILRMKSENAGKAVTLATKDATGSALAQEAGFTTAERVSIKGKRVELTALHAPASNAKPIEKLGRRELSLIASEDLPNSAAKVLTPSDIPLANTNLVSKFKRLFLRLSGGVIEEFDEKTEETRFVVKSPSRSLLFALMTVAVLLVFFIVYVAVPSATIYIAPRVDTLDLVVSATLTPDARSGPNTATTHVIGANFFDLKFSRVLRIGATGEIFRGTNAKGTVTLFNRSPKPKSLVPSRLKSVEGMIFRTLSAVTIPAGSPDAPGQIDVAVVACERDDSKCDCINASKSCRGDFIGERGNLAPTQFVFPAIPSLSPTLYWGESKMSFTGGTTDVTRFISADDLAHVSQTAANELPKIMREEINKLLAEKNQLENLNLKLLDDPKTLAGEILSLAVPPGLRDAKQDGFEVPVTVRVRAVAYSEDELRALIADQLKLKVHPDKVLRQVDFEHVAFRVEESDFSQKRVKLAVTVRGTEEYDLSPNTEAGVRFTEKIRTRILGQVIDEAERYIRNLPEVNNASISSWPFWARTVPELAENVKFEVAKGS